MLGRVTHMLMVRCLDMQWPRQMRRAAAKANQTNDSCGARTHTHPGARSQRLRPLGQTVNICV